MISHTGIIKNCDKVYYIFDGQIKDSGKIDELIERIKQ